MSTATSAAAPLILRLPLELRQNILEHVLAMAEASLRVALFHHADGLSREPARDVVPDVDSFRAAAIAGVFKHDEAAYLLEQLYQPKVQRQRQLFERFRRLLEMLVWYGQAWK